MRPVRHVDRVGEQQPELADRVRGARRRVPWLYIDEDVVGEMEIRTVASRYSLCGEALCIVYDVADDAYIDIEKHLAAALARD